MSQANLLRRAIKERELPHAFFDEHMEALQLRVEDALSGSPPSIDMLIGPSRVGKSMLINSLERQFPETKVNGVRHVPVLVVRVPTPATSKELPRSVLKALGAPTPTAVTSTALMYERMSRQLKLAGTRVILFEEANHIVDVGTKLPPRAAGDWFKQLLDDLGVSVVVFGIPHLERLLESNEQLRYRCGAVMRFNPYAWVVPAEQRHFAACVRTYLRMFEQSGNRFTVDFEPLVRNCYRLTGGLVGVLATFMSRLAYDLRRRGDGEQTVSFEDCAKSASHIGSAGGLEQPAFEEHHVPDIKLHATHTFVLDEASVRYRKHQ